MDEILKKLSKGYVNQISKSEIADGIRCLYKRYTSKDDQTLTDALSASIALSSVISTDHLELSKITPQMKEAFDLAYPSIKLESLGSMESDQISGILSGWKGKYFEVLIRDKLNSGEWVGDVHLQTEQIARLAESATQPGWDLQIVNHDGSIMSELQLKATNSLSYLKGALEKYPDIDIITTDDTIASADNLSNHIFPSGISNEDLQNTVYDSMEDLTDKPFEEFFGDVLPLLPFVIIAVSEGHKALVGHKTFDVAFSSALERSIKTGAAIGVGSLIYLASGSCFLSIPGSFLTRIGFDRYKIMKCLDNNLGHKINAARSIRNCYS